MTRSPTSATTTCIGVVQEVAQTKRDDGGAARVDTLLFASGKLIPRRQRLETAATEIEQVARLARRSSPGAGRWAQRYEALERTLGLGRWRLGVNGRRAGD
ncbi:MAG TPA: hypothetical protein VMV29_16420 [Ktedonobacterales bacterium]|nr:hypothetical protein [Ktedonobacterales bacterium]